MTIISAGDTGAADLPEISNSLRFDGSNYYLTRSYTNTTFTQAALSVWVKRSKLGANQSIFGFGAPGTGYPGLYVFFNSSDQLSITYDDSVNPVGPYTTSAVFRDPSAWYHVVIVWDTTQATQVDRQKVWINGVFQTTSNGLSINASLYLRGTPDTATFGRRPYFGDYYFDGYIANPCVVFGAGFTASSFAYTDPNGQWRSLSKTALQSVVNAGGANSFFLSFDNGASTTTLGNDASSKGNNWTLTNMVRDGSVNDCWSYDTPTNNFATLNQLDKTSGATISNGALIDTLGTPYNTVVRATTVQSSGRWYWEVTQTSAANYLMLGVARVDKTITDVGRFTANGWYYSGFNGTKWTNSIGTAYGAVFTLNDVIGVALDVDAGTLEFFKNGSSQGVAYNTGLVGLPLAPALHDGAADTAASINFGQRPVASGQWYPDAGGYFRYAPPTGYKALSTKNLPDGSVTTSGSFTGNVAADGPFVWINGTPTAMTINGNAVTFGTHADKLANGFKLRTASTSYNNSGSNTYSVTSNAGAFKYNNAEGNP